MVKPSPYSVLVKTEVLAYKSETPGHATKSNDPVAALVPGLLSAGGPTAILRAISSVVVLAFNGHTLRSLSHISYKAFKRFSPTLAHGYTPSAIILVAFVCWAVALSFNLLPCLVLRRLVAVTSVPMCCGPTPARIHPKTSTGTDCSVIQVPIPDYFSGAAIAQAKAPGLNLARFAKKAWCVLQNQKPCEFLSNEREFLSHSGDFVMFSSGLSTPIGGRCDSAGTSAFRQPS